MQVRRIRQARLGIYVFTAFWLLVVLPISVVAAPYAAFVIDARTGEVLHSDNADKPLHPASLTKMMTLYIVFQAIKTGEISLDTQVRISQHAASEPPSKLGLQAGQKIALRYLIRAAAVKSANDAATAIGEALEGSEAAFARRMNRTAKALGMTRSTFRNANGLTEDGHLSTAHDMTILGRHLLYDFPDYYNLFSRRSTDVAGKTVNNTNRRLLDAYQGADGIKTGYTRAAGFNLVASAQRGNERVIATVFGGQSTVSRNARVAELLDLGFRKAPSNAPVRMPEPPQTVLAAAQAPAGNGAKTLYVAGSVTKSLRPKARSSAVIQTASVTVPKSVVVAAREDSASLKAGIAAAISEVTQVSRDGTAPRADDVVLATTQAPRVAPQQEVVTRLSTSGGRHWGINLGRYPSRYDAEKVLLRTALSEMATLDGSLRKVSQTSRGFDANFLGMTRENADLACRRLAARNVSCFMIGPS